MPPLDVMTYYVITQGSPSDFPGKFVLRRYCQDLRTNVASVDMAAWVAGSLEALRTKLPAGLYRIGRNAEDEPQIVEIWI